MLLFINKVRGIRWKNKINKVLYKHRVHYYKIVIKVPKLRTIGLYKNIKYIYIKVNSFKDKNFY